jgi:hypothetical protein
VDEAARVQRLECDGDVVNRLRPAFERAAATGQVAASRNSRPGNCGIDLLRAMTATVYRRERLAASGPRPSRARGVSTGPSSKNLSATFAALAINATRPPRCRRARPSPSTNRAPSSSPGVNSLHMNQPAPLDGATGVFVSAAGCAAGHRARSPVSSFGEPVQQKRHSACCSSRCRSGEACVHPTSRRDAAPRSERPRKFP